MSATFLHTCIRVQDLEASIKFYTEAFGYEESIFQTTNLL